MTMTVTRAWIALLALSAISTALAASGLSGPVLALAVLPVAWGKAQVILWHYLGLAHAPFWRRGFGVALGLYMIGLLGLAIAA